MSEEFRKNAPEPLAPVPFNIGKPFETTLDNGLKIVIFENKRLPLVSYRLAFNSGDINDPQDAIGLTSAMASMLSEGTKNYTSRRFAEEIERLGASISASASDDFTIVAASGLSLYNSDILRLMSEMVFTPTFPEKELDLYKQNTIENLKYQRSQASFLANEQTARILYGEHPYAAISSKASDIEKLSRERLIDQHKKIFIPNDAIFIIVGDVETETLINEIKDLFGKWQKGDKQQAEFPQLPERRERTLTIVDRPGSAQSNIVISSLAFERTNPDYFSFIVMNQVLGAGASSRVFMNLREEKGYTYGAYTRIDTKRLAGDFEATAEVRTPVTGDSLREFFYELDRIKDEKVSEQELQDAQNFLTGVFPIRAETQEGLTSLIVSQKLYNLPDDYLQTYRENVSAVTIEDVENIAKKYIHPDRMAIVIVGDAEEILPQAQSYATKIEIFDTDGNPKEIEEYMQSETKETANVAGKWSLTVDFQGQSFPVSLVLEQSDGTVSGKLESMLGEGVVQDGKVKGDKFSATAKSEIQGQSVELTISGNVENDSMSGSLTAPMIPMPLNFSGSREK
ncbi:MAG: putative Zn-dependent peptidase [Acidobacteria bacterium]|jgi:predicted Zn-dependent peptidase|nr:putative Zn-dependent peptidase [Acidobacteriota bacterium]